MSVIIHTDGSCYPNPGPGGWAAIIQTDQGLKEISGGEKDTTNNRMEILAVIKGLQQINLKSEIVLYSDSQYVVNSYVVNSVGSWSNGKPCGKAGWMVKWQRNGWKKPEGELKNIDLWQEIYSLVKFHQSVAFMWVRGHDNNELNERCDVLALKARQDVKT